MFTDIGFRLPIAKTLYYTTGCNILMVDYRGYGNSTGSPSEAGLRRDAQACLDFLLRAGKSGAAASGGGSGSGSGGSDSGLRDIDPTKIFVFGQSLGGGVASDLVSRNQSSVRGLILENTFTSIADMVFAIVGRMGYPIQSAHRFVEPCVRLFLRFFMTSHWSNIQRIRTIRTPVLFLSGLADELVPPRKRHPPPWPPPPPPPAPPLHSSTPPLFSPIDAHFVSCNVLLYAVL